MAGENGLNGGGGMATAAAGAMSPTARRATPQPVTTNKNVEWLSAPGAWTFIVALIVLSWLMLSLVVDPGLAWTWVHLLHGVITYYLLHWNKGSPVQMDQVCRLPCTTVWSPSPHRHAPSLGTSGQRSFLLCKVLD